MKYEPTWAALVCTRCGGNLEIDYVYDGGLYSEHRSIDEVNCPCGASWDANFQPKATEYLSNLDFVEDND